MKITLILLVLLSAGLLSCEDEQYQKYDEISFDKNLNGTWSITSYNALSSEKVYRSYFVINEDQKGYFCKLAANKEGNNITYYYENAPVSFHLAKSNILLTRHEGSKASINHGRIDAITTDSIIVTETNKKVVYYRPDFLKKKGYIQNDNPELY